MKTPTNWEDNSLARDGARRQRAEAQRQKDIEATIQHYLSMLHTALQDDFQLSEGDIREQVRWYYCARPVVKG